MIWWSTRLQAHTWLRVCDRSLTQSCSYNAKASWQLWVKTIVLFVFTFIIIVVFVKWKLFFFLLICFSPEKALSLSRTRPPAAVRQCPFMCFGCRACPCWFLKKFPFDWSCNAVASFHQFLITATKKKHDSNTWLRIVWKEDPEGSAVAWLCKVPRISHVHFGSSFWYF